MHTIGCKMKKQYSFRLDPHLVKQMDQREETRTKLIEDAIQMYLQQDTQEITNVNLYDRLIESKQSEIESLQEEVKYLRLKDMKRWQIKKYKLLTTRFKNQD